MTNQATMTISCPSGNAYCVVLSDDSILPFVERYGCGRLRVLSRSASIRCVC